MWRGSTWINYNYLIIKGLEKQGKINEADRLKNKTIDYVNKYYEKYGVIFEFYDASDEVDPVECLRKGKPNKTYDIRKKVDSIRDYHWSAALTACLIMG